jgi:hypothetical protein
MCVSARTDFDNRWEQSGDRCGDSRSAEEGYRLAERRMPLPKQTNLGMKQAKCLGAHPSPQSPSKKKGDSPRADEV